MSATSASEPAATQITTAPAPFDKANADIILRTSDQVDFHVFSQILIAASPFFEGMFEVPQPPPEQQQLKYGRPIVDVSEDSTALETLLRICYPITKPNARSLAEIESALRAAMKYEMELPITVLTEDLEAAVYEHPMHVWAVACRLQIEHLARRAGTEMRQALKQPDFSVLGEMEGIKAGDCFRLSCYCRRLCLDPTFEFLSSGEAGSAVAVTSPSIPSIPTTPPPDLICRSLDGVEFRAHGVVLSVASPVLRKKIAAAIPDDRSTTTPVLAFEEHSLILSTLLALIYPLDGGKDELPDNLSSLMALIHAVKEYSVTSLKGWLYETWKNIASCDPLSAYCVAIDAGDAERAEEAARDTLTLEIHSTYVPELEFTSALSYRRLVAYHEKCREVVTKTHADIERVLQPLPRSVMESNQVMYPPALSEEAPVVAKKKGTKSKLKDHRPWLSRHIEKLASRLRSKPGSSIPTLGALFSDATQGDERVWCDVCQLVAGKMVEVHGELQNYVFALQDVVLEV